ncbi:DUF6326 family protein [Salmonirosea aquatica]|uniref:Uncharacterized protein n=1 Tax=Salmonirosea aquatica TaxID=2654236 RepID=A0A7C9FTR7_9BACT|nr:hypothetical protein [Cytophagaceae bacterium SJW1-29]
MKPSSYLQNVDINIKIKLSALWASVTFLYLYGDYFELYVPQKAEGLISGHNLLDSPVKLLLAALLLAIPSLMVMLSVLTKPPLNRWLNLIVGTFYTTIMLLIAATSLTPWRAFYVLYALIESTLTATIVWYAWKWPNASRHE